MSAYSNGCVAQWNIKMDSKPEKIFFIHGMYSNIKQYYYHNIYSSRSWGLPGAQVDWVPDVGVVV